MGDSSGVEEAVSLIRRKNETRPRETASRSFLAAAQLKPNALLHQSLHHNKSRPIPSVIGPNHVLYVSFPYTCLLLKIVNLFNKLDGNGSGELDINEMRALLFESDVRLLL